MAWRFFAWAALVVATWPGTPATAAVSGAGLDGFEPAGWWRPTERAPAGSVDGGPVGVRPASRGTQRLGSGLSTSYAVEGRSEAGDRDEGRLGQIRRSTVSLLVDGQGELRLGRDKMPSAREWEDHDPFGGTGLGRSTRLSAAPRLAPDGGAYDGFRQAGNAVSVLAGGSSPVQAQLTAAAGDSDPGQRYLGGRAGWRAGAFSVSTSYAQTQGSRSATLRDDRATTAWTVGSRVELAGLKLMALRSSLEAGASAQRNWLVGATAPIGPLEGRVAYQRMSGAGKLAGRQAAMLSFGGERSVAHHTAIYGTYARIANEGTAFGVSGAARPLRGQGSSGAEIGLRHAF